MAYGKERKTSVELRDSRCLASSMDWAHSERRDPSGNPIAGTEQPLKEHLTAVGEDTQERLRTAIPRHARWDEWASKVGLSTGLAHDVGKATNEFQQYIRGGKVRAPHKMAGAVIAREARSLEAALAIAGHHGGLLDWRAFESACQQEEAKAMHEASRARAQVQPNFPPTRRHRPNKDALDMEMKTRLLFSALVDADHTDTERHFRPELAEQRFEQPLLPAQRLQTVLRHIDELAQRAELQDQVRVARAQVLEACQLAAERQPGVFTLNVPTGGGKTLASLVFALKHAATHETEQGPLRIIYVLPYLSIIEQNARVIAKALGDESLVLEHHSLAPWRMEEEPDVEPDQESVRRRLASQNWASPIIITTSVQFLETLHANKPSRCRKLHRIARSVVIFDEVQTLPLPLLQATLQTLEWMVQNAGLTLVLCTATMPALVRSEWQKFGFAAERVTEIVEPQPLFKRLKRVDYQFVKEEITVAELAEKMLTESPRVLTIVNTTRSAALLHQALVALGCPDALHLSARMCPAHRSKVLAEVKRRLDARQPCRLVATQVVEAGCDLDFPWVLREMGPLDAIAQAAGRCNREGKLHWQEAVVQVFHLKGGRIAPGIYKIARDKALRFVRRDLHNPQVFLEYFGELYNAEDTDDRRLLPSRQELDFQKVADGYWLIEEGLQVLVPYEDKEPEEDAPKEDGAALITRLRAQGMLTPRDWRGLQRFSVNLRTGSGWEDYTDELFPKGPRWLLKQHYHPERGVRRLIKINSSTTADAVAIHSSNRPETHA